MQVQPARGSFVQNVRRKREGAPTLTHPVNMQTAQQLSSMSCKAFGQTHRTNFQSQKRVHAHTHACEHTRTHTHIQIPPIFFFYIKINMRKKSLKGISLLAFCGRCDCFKVMQINFFKAD